MSVCLMRSEGRRYERFWSPSKLQRLLIKATGPLCTYLTEHGHVSKQHARTFGQTPVATAYGGCMPTHILMWANRCFIQILRPLSLMKHAGDQGRIAARSSWSR